MAVSETVQGAIYGAAITACGSIVVALIGKRKFLQSVVEKHVEVLLNGYQKRIEELTASYEKRIGEITASYEGRLEDLTSEIRDLREELRAAHQLPAKPAAVQAAG